METFELILILLACVILSAVLDQVVRRVSLPLVQVAVGFVAALVVPHVSHVSIDSELFLVLFIAPLLFNEARECGRDELWNNKVPILSLAIGLVLITVLVVGFALNWMVPSIPLAAAFACAGALGPTDAAAVGALGSTIKLSARQKILLAGDALVNDASGVVSFQFAIAAAVTGAFSVPQAATSFAFLFLGGIAAGAFAGLAAFASISLLRSRGFENTNVHVLYEVFTPFVVFLAAEALGVSGILAVVAAGIVMARYVPRLPSASLARQQVLSEGVWQVLVFLINGVVFVMLGMQLPQAMSPEVASSYSLPQLAGIIAVLTLLVVATRFLWVTLMEFLHRRIDAGRHGTIGPSQTLRDALVMTIAGPKGAITLSIILTIPEVVESGAPFPERSLIIFLASGVILATLVIADVFLPLIAPRKEAEVSEEELAGALVKVLEATTDELQARLLAGGRPEYEPAMRLMEARYRSRLIRERFAHGTGDSGEAMRAVMREVMDVQQGFADEFAQAAGRDYDHELLGPYHAFLRSIRSSVGYYGEAVNVGSRSKGMRARLAMLWQAIRPTEVADERTERMYRDMCQLAIKMEHAAIGYLQDVIESDDGQRAEAARVLLDEHHSVLDSLRARLEYGDGQAESSRHTGEGLGQVKHDSSGRESSRHTGEGQDASRTHGAGEQPALSRQFAIARRYADEVYAEGLAIELGQIRHLRDTGAISEAAARQLREDVYHMQMALD